MSAAPARFTFDLDLARREPSQPAAAPAEPALSQADVEAARQLGFAAGYAEAEQGATAQAARRLAAAAENIGNSVAALAARLDDQRHAMLTDAVDLASGIGRKLAGTLIEQYPTAEIAALVGECLASLDDVPHLVIRCHPGLADAVRDIATARMATSGFTGRLVVMGEPDQALGDCRLEWVDGGLVRDRAAIDAEIDQRIADWLAAKAAAADTKHSPSTGTTTEPKTDATGAGESK